MSELDAAEVRVGRHEAQLLNLEKGQAELKQDIKDLKVEMEHDLKALVSAIKEVFLERQDRLEKRMDRIENSIMWLLGTAVIGVCSFIFAKVVGG